MITYTLSESESNYDIDFQHIMEECGYEFTVEQMNDLMHRIEVGLMLLAGVPITDEVKSSLVVATIDIINAWIEDIGDVPIKLWADEAPYQHAVKFKEGAEDATIISD